MKEVPQDIKDRIEAGEIPPIDPDSKQPPPNFIAKCIRIAPGVLIRFLPIIILDNLFFIDPPQPRASQGRLQDRTPLL